MDPATVAKIREEEIERATLAVRAMILPKYLFDKFKKLRIFVPKRADFYSTIKNANLIVEDTSDGKTKVAIFDEIYSIVKENHRIMDGVASIVNNTGVDFDEQFEDEPVYTRETNAVKLEDDFLNAIDELREATPILEELLKLNDQLFDDLTASFEQLINQIAAPLHYVSCEEVKSIADQEGKNPRDNIDLGAVQKATSYISSSIYQINETADKMEEAYHKMHDTDDLTAKSFLENLLKDKKSKKNNKSIIAGNGGDQTSPYNTFKNGSEAEKAQIREVIHRYYPDMNDDQIEDFLLKLEAEGCGYVSSINTFVGNYTGTEEEFEATFGFPMYKVVDGKKVFNYDLMIVDFYASQDNHNLVDGADRVNKHEDPTRTKEGDSTSSLVIDPRFRDLFPALKNDDEDIKGYGTTSDQRKYRFEEYMNDHGIDVKVKSSEGLAATVSGEDNIAATTDNYNRYSAEGSSVMISVQPVHMVGLDGEVVDQPGGHSMTVVGKTGDGKLVVSSWGKLYVLDPDYYQNSNDDGRRANFQIANYGD